MPADARRPEAGRPVVGSLDPQSSRGRASTGGSAASPTATPTSTAGQPGFGVVVGLAALVGLLLAARVRR